MASSAKRKTSILKTLFVRKYSRKATLISRGEKLAGMGVLILLAGVAVAIHHAGQRPSTQTPVVRETGASEDISHAGPMIHIEWEAAIMPSTAATQSTESALPKSGSLLPASPNPEWKLDGEFEQFNAENLYEKINGRAEAYISYGFVGLDCASYVAAADENEFVDLFVFDHGQPLHAFAIFASERSPDAPALTIGREGYDAAGSIFFWKGMKYVQVIPSSDQEKTKAFALEIARTVEANIEDAMEPLPGLQLLPAENQVASSAQYILKSALSQDFLDSVYTARYSAGSPDQTLRMFVSERKDEAEATALLAQYREYLSKYAKPAPLTLEGLQSASGDMAGTFECVFVKGKYFAGITEAPSAESAKAAAETLKGHLK